MKTRRFTTTLLVVLLLVVCTVMLMSCSMSDLQGLFNFGKDNSEDAQKSSFDFSKYDMTKVEGLETFAEYLMNNHNYSFTIDLYDEVTDDMLSDIPYNKVLTKSDLSKDNFAYEMCALDERGNKVSGTIGEIIDDKIYTYDYYDKKSYYETLPDTWEASYEEGLREGALLRWWGITWILDDHDYTYDATKNAFIATRHKDGSIASWGFRGENDWISIKFEDDACIINVNAIEDDLSDDASDEDILNAKLSGTDVITIYDIGCTEVSLPKEYIKSAEEVV